MHRGEEIEKKSRGGATCRSASGGRRRCAVANEWTTFVFGGDKIGGVVGLKKILLPPSIYIGPNVFFETAFDY